MGCGDACPIFPGVSYEDWELEDRRADLSLFAKPERETTAVRSLLARLVDYFIVSQIKRHFNEPRECLSDMFNSSFVVA